MADQTRTVIQQGVPGKTQFGCIAALCLLVMGVPRMAHADIYSFTDRGGVTHFSNVPSDSRFELLLATPVDAAPAITQLRSVDWLARSAKYDAAISSAAKSAAIQAALVRAVILVESGFNPKAISSRGAMGLMQLRPATARRYGVNNIYDPEQNIRAGASYLRDLLRRFDSNLELALAAYNAGEEAVERHGRHIPPYRETMSYVPYVMSVYQHLVDQADRAKRIFPP
jgi:soluble lytic murein transglycosylase-like protein